MGSLVVKDNALIEASHKLSESEQRLILLAIVKGREFCDSVEQLKGKELTIHADDYMQAFGVDKSTAYRVLKRRWLICTVRNGVINISIKRAKRLYVMNALPNQLNMLKVVQRLNSCLPTPLFPCWLSWNATLPPTK